MTKTTPAPRVRALNLYTVESNGKPVAQAMAISQAEAVALWVASQQQPVLSARMSTPLEARTLAGLPLLQRDPAVTDTRTADLFGDAPAADHVEESRAMVEPLAAGGFAPCGRALGDCGKATQTCGRDGCGAEVVEMPPQHAPIEAVTKGLASGLPAEFVDYIVGQEPAAEQPVEPTHAERMASAYAVGVEIARQGHTRWSAEFLDANAAALRGLRDAAADEAHAEMLRGFEDGQPIPARKPELKQRAEEAAAPAGGKIVAKYRDPATGQTWSGRGLKPRWLVAAIEEGRTLDEFLIENQGAQA